MKIPKPPRHTYAYIRSLTSEIREKCFTPPDKIPVDIEHLIEFKYGITIVPEIGLYTSTGTEGVLLSDLKTIIIDSGRYYEEEKYYKRIRFTLAHELGHLILHEKEIRSMQYSTIDEWKTVIKEISDEDSVWYERHADEFAGSLLVPKTKLESLINDSEIQIQEILKNDEIEDIKDATISTFAKTVSDKFMVSPGVIEIRIKHEKLDHYFDSD